LDLTAEERAEFQQSVDAVKVLVKAMGELLGGA
jgi:hypothetical protein